MISASCTYKSAPETPTPQAEVSAQEASIVEEEVLSEEAAAAYEEERLAAEQAQAELEASTADAELVVLGSGSFAGIAPGHNAEGGVTVKDNGENVLIELDASFASDTGPDLYVILTQEQTLTGADPVQLDTSKIVKIAPLVNLQGAQSYEISKADFEANGYAVVIWCNEFNVVFGAATLN